MSANLIIKANQPDEKRNDNIKYKVSNKLSDADENLMNDLINLTNLRSENEKKIFKKKKAAKDEQASQDLDHAFNLEYLKQSGFIGFSFDSEYQSESYRNEVILTIQQIVDKLIKIETINYRNDVKSFNHIKNTWKQFDKYLDDELKNVQHNLNAITYKIDVAKRQLEERVYERNCLEKRIRDKLCKELPTSEACYKLLTWLSPPEWKKKFNVDDDKLEYDIIHLNANAGEDNCVLSEYIHSERVPEMYWTSAEQIIAKLNSFETRIRKKMIAKTMINNLYSKNENTVDKLSVPKMNWQSGEIVQYPMTDGSKKKKYKCIKCKEERNAVKTTIVNIKTIMSDFFRKHNIRNMYTGIELLFTKLNETIVEREKIPKYLMKKTEIIFKSIVSQDERLERSEMLRRNKIKAAQRTADRTKEMARTDVRKQKLLPYRSLVPPQNRIKTPEKPQLNYKQLMYLKYLTNMTLEDIPDHLISEVPEFEKLF